MTDDEQVREAVEVADSGEGLHAAVAAAGTGWAAPLAAVPVDAWRHVVEVNLTGTFLTLRHAGPRLAGGGGAVTVISTGNAVRQARFLSPYCASKAGVEMLVRCAADEWGGAGIRVNAVRPGLVPTQMSQDLVDDEEIRHSFLRQIPCRGSARPRTSPRPWPTCPATRRHG